MRSHLLLALAILCTTGCSTIISRQSLTLVDPGITFVELRKDPGRYEGKYLLLGGGIAGVRNTNAGGELEVVQFATDESGEITTTAASGGASTSTSNRPRWPIPTSRCTTSIRKATRRRLPG